MNEIKVGDFVQVVSGPAYVEGQLIKGRVREVFAAMDYGVPGLGVLVKVASGGEWGFRAQDLRVLPKRGEM